MKETMSSRERVVAAISHREPDRVPLDLGGWTTGINIVAYRNLLDFFGIKEQPVIYEIIQQLALVSEEVKQKLAIDTRYISPGSPSKWKLKIKEVETTRGRALQYTDEWGVTRLKPFNGGHWFDIVEHPLKKATIEDLENYPWPDPEDPSRFKGLAERARELWRDTEYAIVSDITGSMFEMAWYMRGYGEWMQDLIINQYFVEKLMDILLRWWLDFYEIYLEEIGEYIDVICTGDDIAMQTGSVYSLDFHRKIIKPRQKILYDFIHNHTKAKIFYHGCGGMYNFFPELIDVGVDIVNPVQVSAAGMQTDRLKTAFGDKLTFWGGGCDTQSILPLGTPDHVEQEVMKRIDDLAPGGGFVFATVHNIQPEVPPENIARMYEMARIYGSYSSLRN